MSQIQVELQEWMGSDRAIALSAWTSSTTKEGKETRTDDDVKRVVRMLAESGHAVPFESVVMRFWIKMPIMIDRQHMTHRLASQNGMSARYRTMPEEYFLMPDDVRGILQKINAGIYGDNYDMHCQATHESYRHLTVKLKEAESEGLITNHQLKRVREFVRGELPQSSMTERVTTINLRSFANYIRLRLSFHAQPEIMEVARQMYLQVRFREICPTALDAISSQGWLLDKPNHEWRQIVDAQPLQVT